MNTASLHQPVQPSAGADAIIDEMVRRIVAQFDPEKVILFGSRARGDARADSDVDLLVVMPVEGSVFRKMTEIRCALQGLGLSTDVVILTRDYVARYATVVGTIPFAASREGRLLYEAFATPYEPTCLRTACENTTATSSGRSAKSAALLRSDGSTKHRCEPTTFPNPARCRESRLFALPAKVITPGASNSGLGGRCGFQTPRAAYQRGNHGESVFHRIGSRIPAEGRRHRP